MGPPPSWAKGVGHGEELQYMFDAGTILPSLKEQGLSENDQVFSFFLLLCCLSIIYQSNLIITL
jgi:hypothetical protein